MPLLIANNWNALREGVAENENGEKYFTGSIVVTFFLENTVSSCATGMVKRILVEKGTSGKVVKVLDKDEDGKRVVKFYKIMYEHQAVIKSVTKITHKSGGFDGWSFKLSSDITVMLPKGRCETKDEIVMSEPVPGSNEQPKPKTVQVRTQDDNLLNAIMSVAPTDSVEIVAKKSATSWSINDMFDCSGRIRRPPVTVSEQVEMA